MSWAAFALPSGATSGLAEQLCAKPLRDRPEEDTRACSRAEVQALAAGQDGAVDKALGLAAAPAPRAEALPLWAPQLGELPVPPCFVRKPKGVMDLGQAEPRQQARHGLQAALEAGGALPPIQPVVVLCLTPPDSLRQVVLQTRISVWLNSVRGKPLPLPERQRRANELAAFDARLAAVIPQLAAGDEAAQHLARLLQMVLDRTADFVAASNLAAISAMYATPAAPVTVVPAQVLGPATNHGAYHLLQLESLSAGMHLDEKGSPSFAALLGSMAALRMADLPALKAFARANSTIKARYENRGKKPQPQADSTLANLVDEGARLGKNAGEEARAVACSLSKDSAILFMLATAPPSVLSFFQLGTRSLQAVVVQASDDTVTKLFQIMRSVGTSRKFDKLIAKIDSSQRLTSMIAGKHGISVLWWLTGGCELSVEFKLRLLAMLDSIESTELLRLEGAINCLPLLSQRAEHLALLEAAVRHPAQAEWTTLQDMMDMDPVLDRDADPYEGDLAPELLEEFTPRQVEALKQQPPHHRTLLEHTIVLLQTCEHPRALAFAPVLASSWRFNDEEGPPAELVEHMAALLHINWKEAAVASALATLPPGEGAGAQERMADPLADLERQYAAALPPDDGAVTLSAEGRRVVSLQAMCTIPPQTEWHKCRAELAGSSWACAALHAGGATSADIKAKKEQMSLDAKAAAAAAAAAAPLSADERAGSALWVGASQLNCTQHLLQACALAAGTCSAATAAALAATATAVVLEHMPDVLATGRLSVGVMQTWLASCPGASGCAASLARLQQLLATELGPTQLDTCLMETTGQVSMLEALLRSSKVHCSAPPTPPCRLHMLQGSPEEAWQAASDADVQAAMQQAQQAGGALFDRAPGQGAGGVTSSSGRAKRRKLAPQGGGRRRMTRSAAPQGEVQGQAG